jgi:hypothetical protein
VALYVKEHAITSLIQFCAAFGTEYRESGFLALPGPMLATVMPAALDQLEVTKTSGGCPGLQAGEESGAPRSGARDMHWGHDRRACSAFSAMCATL